MGLLGLRGKSLSLAQKIHKLTSFFLKIDSFCSMLIRAVIVSLFGDGMALMIKEWRSVLLRMGHR